MPPIPDSPPDLPLPWTVVENAPGYGHSTRAADGSHVFIGSATFPTCSLIVHAVNELAKIPEDERIEMLGAAMREQMVAERRARKRGEEYGRL